MSFNIEDTMTAGTNQQKQQIYFHPEQVKWLEKVFPEPLHTPNTTAPEMYYQAGIRRVVALIKDRMK